MKKAGEKQEKKVESNAEAQGQNSEQGPAKKSATPGSRGAAALKATTDKVSKTAKQVAERTANGAAKVGKAARELGEGIQKTVENDIAPAAERVRKGVSATSKKVREELGPAADKARKGVSAASKKVREELGPAAEKAGKGLRAMFRATARATSKSARILGIKAGIAAVMRKQHRLFADLGEAYFRTQKKKTPSKSDSETLSSLVSAIEKVTAEIHALEVKEKTARQSQ